MLPMLNCYCYVAILKPFNRELKKWAQAHFKMLSRKCVNKSYIFDIYVWTGFGIK